MAETPKVHDLRDIIPELTDSELSHVQKQLSDGVVVKYLRSLAYSAIMDVALTSVDAKETTEQKALRDAYNKGVIELIQQLLNGIPKT